MKKIFEKINFRQPKYMLPAILYIPLLGASYFIFDLFHTETADIPDKTLQTTEFLNPELPEAQMTALAANTRTWRNRGARYRTTRRSAT